MEENAENTKQPLSLQNLKEWLFEFHKAISSEKKESLENSTIDPTDINIKENVSTDSAEQFCAVEILAHILEKKIRFKHSDLDTSAASDDQSSNQKAEDPYLFASSSGNTLLIEKVFGKVEADVGVPVLLTGSETGGGGGESRLGALSYLAFLSSIIHAPTNIPSSLSQPFQLSSDSKSLEGSEERESKISSCFECGSSAGILGRIVLSEGARVVHRSCFHCYRCQSKLRRGLYTVVSTSRSGAVKSDHYQDNYECLRHEHDDLLQMFDNSKSNETAKKQPEPNSIIEPHSQENDAIAISDSDVGAVNDSTITTTVEGSVKNETTAEKEKEEAVKSLDIKSAEKAEQPRELESSDSEKLESEKSCAIPPETTVAVKDGDTCPNGSDVPDEHTRIITKEIKNTNMGDQIHQDSEAPANMLAPEIVVQESDDMTSVANAKALDVESITDLRLGQPDSDNKVKGANIDSLETPVAPPRRKKKGGSRASSQNRSESAAPECESESLENNAKAGNIRTPKPIPPPKPASLKSHKSGSSKSDDLYPDQLNPFDSDSEDNDDRTSTKSGDEYDDSLNPFADDDDFFDDHVSNTVSGDVRIDSENDNFHGPSPAVRLRNSSGHSTGRYSMIETSSPPATGPHKSGEPNRPLSTFAGDHSLRKPKRPAPPPPSGRNIPKQVGTTPSRPPRPPQPIKRKKRPAPPPPVPFKRQIVTEECLSKEQIEERLKTLDEEQTTLEQKTKEIWDMLLSQLVQNEETAPDLEDMEGIQSWLDLCVDKCSMMQREAELVLLWRKHYLDEIHGDVEFQLRCLIEKPESEKFEGDSRLEARLLLLLLDVIERKNKLVESQLPPASWDDAPDRSNTDDGKEKQKEKEKKKKKKLKLRLKKIKIKLSGSGDNDDSKADRKTPVKH